MENEDFEEKEVETEDLSLKEENANLKRQLVNLQVREELKDDITYKLQTIIKQDQEINELKTINETLNKIGKNLNILCKLMDKKK
jgi:hypothetical protein